MTRLEDLLEGKFVNRNTVRALVIIYYNGGKQIKDNYNGGTFGSQNSTNLHFGFNSITSIDSLIVRWNENNTQTFFDISANQKVHLKENSKKYLIVGCMDSDNLYYNALADYNIVCYMFSIIGCIDKDVINFTADSTYNNDECFHKTTETDIDETVIANRIKIYPNSFKEKTIIDFGVFGVIDVFYDLYI